MRTNFSRAYTITPLCSLARAATFSGLLPLQSEFTDNVCTFWLKPRFIWSKRAAGLREEAANGHLRRCLSHTSLRVRAAPHAWHLTIRRSRQNVASIPHGPLVNSSEHQEAKAEPKTKIDACLIEGGDSSLLREACPRAWQLRRRVPIANADRPTGRARPTGSGAKRQSPVSK